MTDTQGSRYSEWKGWRAGSFGNCPRNKAAYFAAEVARVRGLDRGAAKVLEIGSGNGEFAGWARAEGWTYSGTELLEAQLKEGRAAGFDIHPATLDLLQVAGAGTQDLIVAFDVLEHLTLVDLARLLDSARMVLRENGRILARVPSGDSPFARHIQHGDVTHKSVLGSSAIRQLAESARLAVGFIGSPVMVFRGLPPTTLIRRSLVMAACWPIHLTVRNLLMGDSCAIISPNLVFCLEKGNARQSSEATL